MNMLRVLLLFLLVGLSAGEAQAAPTCTEHPIRFDALSRWSDQRESAEASARERAAAKCGGTYGGISSISVQCSKHSNEKLSLDAKGKVTKVEGEPRWLCAAHGACVATRRICDAGKAGASSQ